LAGGFAEVVALVAVVTREALFAAPFAGVLLPALVDAAFTGRTACFAAGVAFFTAILRPLQGDIGSSKCECVGPTKRGYVA
jgi:hypothetical protein